MSAPSFSSRLADVKLSKAEKLPGRHGTLNGGPLWLTVSLERWTLRLPGLWLRVSTRRPRLGVDHDAVGASLCDVGPGSQEALRTGRNVGLRAGSARQNVGSY